MIFRIGRHMRLQPRQIIHRLCILRQGKGRGRARQHGGFALLLSQGGEQGFCRVHLPCANIGAGKARQGVSIVRRHLHNLFKNANGARGVALGQSRVAHGD